MDKTDIKLLGLLAEDAGATATSLVSKLNLSVPAINKRIAKLKADGVIRKTVVLTDPEKVGQTVTVCILLALENFNQSEEFFQIIQNDPEIMECYAISGEYDYWVKVCTSSVFELEEKLLVMKQHGVAKSNTLFALREYKCSATVLPRQAKE